jgi:hypothetical protein
MRTLHLKLNGKRVLSKTFEALRAAQTPLVYARRSLPALTLSFARHQKKALAVS